MGKHYVAVRSGSLESSETLSDVTCAIHPLLFQFHAFGFVSSAARPCSKGPLSLLLFLLAVICFSVPCPCCRYCFRIRRSQVKVDLGFRGRSWLASPDEYRLCNSRSIPKPSFVVIHSECPGSTVDTNCASVYGALEEAQTISTW